MKTTVAHHPDCPMEIYWDVQQEAGAYCNCPRFWPRRVCETCWQPPKLHLKTCPHRGALGPSARSPKDQP